MTPAALLVALYTFIAGLVAGWVVEPDTPTNSNRIPWWLAISFGLTWPIAAVLLALLVGSWWLDDWRPDPRGAAPNRPADRGTSHWDLP